MKTARMSPRGTMSSVAFALPMLAGCEGILGIDDTTLPPDGSGAGGGTNGSEGAEPPPCDLEARFGPVRSVDALNVLAHDEGLTLSEDGLTAYLASNQNEVGGYDLFVTTRASVTADWNKPTLAPLLNTVNDERQPKLFKGGLGLLYSNSSTQQIFTTTRESLLDDFPAGEPLANVNAGGAGDPELSRDERELYLLSNRPDEDGPYDIYRALRLSSDYGTPELVAELSEPAYDDAPGPLSSDGLRIYFASTRPLGSDDTRDLNVWTARRDTPDGTFYDLEPLTELNSTVGDWPEALSADGCTLYLTSAQETGYNIYVATKP